MNESNPEAADATDPRHEQTQDFDLRVYLDAVIAWWKEILLLTLLSAAVAGFGVYLRDSFSEPQYEAIADVVTARLVSEVALDDRMTIVGDVTIDSGSAARRRAALNMLGKSGKIAEAVSIELAGILSEDERVPNSLVDKVMIETPSTPDGKSPSDLIRIHVVSDDPDKSAAIANSWARHYIELINSVFGQVPLEISESVEAELVSAEEAYKVAQSTFEDRVATNRTASIQQEIQRLIAQRDILQQSRDQILAAIVEQDQAVRLQFFQDLVNAQAQAHYNVLENQSSSQLRQLDHLYRDRDLALRYLGIAQSLEDQIRLGGDGAVESNRETIQLLKNQVFSLSTSVDAADTTASGAPSFIIMMDPSDILLSTEEQTADIQALISALENYIENLDENTREVSQGLLEGDDFQFLDQMNAQSVMASAQLTPTGVISGTEQAPNDLSVAIIRSYMDLFEVGDLVQGSQVSLPEQSPLAKTLDQLDMTIQELRAEVAAEEADMQLLTQQRDLAWNVYTTLSQKVAELGIEESAATTEVRMGSQALAPVKPMPNSSPMVSAALAGAIGLLMAIFLALLANYLGYEPILGGRRV